MLDNIYMNEQKIIYILAGIILIASLLFIALRFKRENQKVNKPDLIGSSRVETKRFNFVHN